MADPLKRPRLGGGFLLAAATMTGAIAGVALRQPSAGLLAGVAVGAALAVVVWLVDRR